MNPLSETEFRELMIRALEGTLDDDGEQRLAALCRADEDLARRFGRQVEVDRLAEMALRNLAGVDFGRSVMQRIADQREPVSPFVASVIGKVAPAPRRSRRWLAAGAGIAAAAALWLGISYYPRADAAHLYRGDAAKWLAPPSGETLASGSRLKLESGLAEIHFRNGAEVILEGPADFEIRGTDKGFLHAGRVSVRVPEQAVGFTLDSPGGRVVDLGTAFGIHVSSDGRTEAEVFEGEIQVRPRGEGKKVLLGRNEKFVSKGNTWRKDSGIDANSFVTNLPPVSPATPDYVHWPLNEGAGGIAASRGRLPSGGPPPADLRNAGGAQGGLPQWIDGPYGRALSFDGWGASLETHQPGVTGDAARTVTFWLRLPKDFNSEQGYGIVSWGDLTARGNAWQISINPYPNEGLVGRLRIGIYPSLVTGSTDLRDGKWHHCAVVLYKDVRNDQRVPVLLYVDGRMEATASKGVISPVRTSSSENSRPVWIARSLRHEEPKQSRGTGFFRGDLDEIYIFNGALNQRQIENLMQFNTLFPNSSY